MLVRATLLSVACAFFVPSVSLAESRGDVVRDLKGHYPVDLLWNSGHVEQASAGVVAANLQATLRARNAASANLTIHSGVKSYTESYEVGVSPFKRTVRITRYVAWAGAKRNLFQSTGATVPKTVYIYNQTAGPIFFSFRTNNESFQEYRLEPGTHHWFSNRGNPRFEVRFDNNYAPGFQSQQYTLAAGSHNDFRKTGNHLDLYHR